MSQETTVSEVAFRRAASGGILVRSAEEMEEALGPEAIERLENLENPE